MKIISGGQSGVDRAALDVAVELRIAYSGWCPKGGWAEDMPIPPGLLARYPALKETPLADPAQRTEWNVRDADASLFLTDARGLSVSKGSVLAHELAERYQKPVLFVKLGSPGATERTAAWLATQRDAFGDGLSLAIGGPRESEAPGIYAQARSFIAAVLERCRE